MAGTPTPVAAVEHDSGGDRVLWESVAGEAFLTASRGAPDVHESRGFFTIRDAQTPHTMRQSLDGIDAASDAVVLHGWLEGGTRVSWRRVPCPR